jgi:hypothetical protein
VPSATPLAAIQFAINPLAVTASTAEQASFAGEALALTITSNYQAACYPTASRSSLKDISAGILFSFVSSE